VAERVVCLVSKICDALLVQQSPKPRICQTHLASLHFDFFTFQPRRFLSPRLLHFHWHDQLLLFEIVIVVQELLYILSHEATNNV